MKKYFIAALALASIVACSKDDVSDPVLDSSKKSVSITIANMETTTRAEYEGTETPAGATGTACTSINDGNFYFMFAKADGTITNVYNGKDVTLEDGAYRFHKLSEEVKCVAVVGNLTTAPKIGQTIDLYEFMAETETNDTVKADYKNLVVYASNDLSPTGEVCVIDDGSTTPHEYPLYKATLTVAPKMSRIEIGQISCTDFATASPKYSHIGIETVTLLGVDGGDSYVHKFGNFTSSQEVESATANVLTTSTPAITPNNGNVWSWNIKPQDVSNMVTKLFVVGDGFTTKIPNRTVTIVEYKDANGTISSFDEGVIYNLNINFNHSNIDGASDVICADVKVEIKPWTVKAVNVGFATGTN